MVTVEAIETVTIEIAEVPSVGNFVEEATKAKSNIENISFKPQQVPL